jgi:hypothetical protein
MAPSGLRVCSLRPAFFISATASGALGDLLEARIRRHEARVHAAHEAFDLFAQAALREREHHGGLAHLLGGGRLLLAQDVEGAGDDLTLLLGQRAHLGAAATPAAPAAARRGGRLEFLAEGPHAQEIDVARGLLAAAGVVVGRARSITASPACLEFSR